MKLTGDIVCAIIKTCSESKVASFEMGALKVSFHKHEVPVVYAQEVFEPQLQEVISTQTLERDELALKEEQLAQMEIEDPVAYEKAVAMGDFFDSKVGDGLNEEDSGPE